MAASATTYATALKLRCHHDQSPAVSGITSASDTHAARVRESTIPRAIESADAA
jgi:hypothetical protein